MTIAVVTGTRPEIIKMYPIIKQFDSRSIEYKYIHTGQHYDYNLFLKFIEEFEIRKPDICISADGTNPVSQVANIMEKIGNVMNKLRPSLVLVEGDTNSVLAGALAALKSKIPIAHIESGLRSNDWKTVEEHNRRVVDHISDMLFSPTEISTNNLQKEHVHGDIHTVGNTIIDAINLCLAKETIDSNKTHTKGTPESLEIGQQQDDFILVTMHRSESVDDINVLRQVLMALSDSNLNCIFPMHPHTLKRIREYGLTKHIGNVINIIPPLSYLDFLRLLVRCTFIITDSGGVQEEITSPKINKRALVLRDCTERPESVESGHSILCKVEYKAIMEQIERFHINHIKNINEPSPYGAGDSAIKITNILERKYLE
jgi:UDP-N-acetylglucosamine 2-epimerase (non-hydrolysing)